MADIYLSKYEPESKRRDFYLGDRPLNEIITQFGVNPENREPAMPDHIDPEKRLLVVVSVRQDEAEGTGFEAGYYRAAIMPHHALRHCGIGLSAILGAARIDC